MIDWLICHMPDPRKVLVFDLLHLGVWLALVPFAVTVWSQSIPFVVFMSVWALVLGGLTRVAAVCAEIKADPAIEVPPAQSGQS